MKLKYFLFSIFATLILVSCGAKKNVTTSTPKKPKTVVVKTNPTEEVIEVVEETKTQPSKLFLDQLEKENPRLNKRTFQYIRKFYPIAVSEMRANKIPASITLAQGILESGNGFSDLASRSNNHFGIKCHRGWRGARVYHDDDEKGECFRKYVHPDTSYRDHSQFLVGRTRYASLFNLDITDYKRWAKGLRKAGYATDRKYPQKLISLIERYQLYKFDTMNFFSEDNIKEADEIVEEKVKVYYKVKQGDTLYSIAKANNTTVENLKIINSLTSNNLSTGQKLVLY